MSGSETATRPHTESRSHTESRWLAYPVLALGLIFAIVPVYWMVSSAFKSSPELSELNPSLYPHHPTLHQFSSVLAGGSLARSLVTSGVLAVLTSVIVVFFGAMAAYAVSHWKFRGSQSFLVLVLVSQLLPQSAVMVPIYLLWSHLGLIGTRGGLGLVYVAVFLPVAVWMLTGYLESIPVELTEAGLVDGASRLRILISIILPVAGPALAATAIYTALACWSEFLLALVLLTGDTQTATINLASLIGQHGTDVGQLMAASTIATLPPLVAFFALQRFFESGLTVGSVKG